MDEQPKTTQPISDDQELAKALAGVTKETEAIDNETTASVSEPVAPVTNTATSEPLPTAFTPLNQTAQPAPVAPEPVSTTPTPVSTDLESIKKDALTELRPLVDKLELAPEEKFDTYLLLLRSTDDKALIGPAHQAAQAITDETRRAQALLDVIKEIDYFSNGQQ
ncbi:hypothetical protein HGB25_00690 [Candidatus Saccharibacteria bacterium]|nr:hypothetical protein [Candidatus Saccharibacteria bacterium]